MIKYLLLFFLVAFPAYAQRMVCDNPTKVIEGLQKNSNESIIAAGSINDKLGILITATPDGSTWSILTIDREKICFLAAGKDFKAVREGQ
jgi:hypothetical protein